MDCSCSSEKTGLEQEPCGGGGGAGEPGGKVQLSSSRRPVRDVTTARRKVWAVWIESR